MYEVDYISCLMKHCRHENCSTRDENNKMTLHFALIYFTRVNIHMN
jgi:hypothetical protein